jgi:hypothetical protein
MLLVKLAISTGLTHKAPQPPNLGELNLVLPIVGGLGGLINGYCVSPVQLKP